MIQIYTKFENFVGQYFPLCTTFCCQTLQFYQFDALVKKMSILPGSKFSLIGIAYSGITMLNNIVDNIEQCQGSKTLFIAVFISHKQVQSFIPV